MISEKIDNIIDPFKMMKKAESGFSYLKRKWWILVLAAIAGTIVGYFWGQTKKTTYQSHLTFSLEENSNTGMGNIASIAAQFGLAGSGENVGMFSGDNIIEVLKSRRMVESVLLSTDTFENDRPVTLADYYLHLNKNSNTLTEDQPIFLAGSDRNKLTYQQDSILYKIYAGILEHDIKVARPDMELNIFELSFASPNEKFTKVFTDRILDETTKFYTELKTKKSQETLDALEQRVASLKGNLNNSISGKASAQDANVNPAFAAPLVPVQKRQIDMQAYGGAYEELYKNLELARYQLLQKTPLLQVIDEANYPMEKITPGKIKYAAEGAIIFVLLISVLLSLFSVATQRLSK